MGVDVRLDSCRDIHESTASPQPLSLCLPQFVRAAWRGYDLGYWFDHLWREVGVYKGGCF
jgi:hypothetical protein